jgi:hypothetical protein
VSAEIHEKFVKAAEANGRTLSEEVTRRACQSFEWEAAHETAQAMLADITAKAVRITEENTQAQLERELRRRGYTLVRGVNGAAWFTPGTDSITWIFETSTSRELLEDMLERAATRALEKLAGRKLEPQKPRRKS